MEKYGTKNMPALRGLMCCSFIFFARKAQYYAEVQENIWNIVYKLASSRRIFVKKIVNVKLLI